MNRQINAMPGRQNLWGRTARIPGEQAAAVEPRSFRIGRLLGLLGDTRPERREAFVDTVPSVMFDPE